MMEPEEEDTEEQIEDELTKLISNGKYKEAAMFAALPQNGSLRTPETIQKFQRALIKPGESLAVLIYLDTVAENAKLNQFESLELCRLCLTQDKKKFLRLFGDDKLELSESLADTVKQVDSSLAAVIYERLGIQEMVIRCLIESNQLAKIKHYCKVNECVQRLPLVLEELLRIFPEKAVDFAIILVGGKNPVVTIKEAVDIFMGENETQLCGEFLLRSAVKPGNKATRPPSIERPSSSKSIQAVKPQLPSPKASPTIKFLDENSIKELIRKKSSKLLKKLEFSSIALMADKFLQLPLDGRKDRVWIVVEIIFEYVIDSPKHSRMCAELLESIYSESKPPLLVLREMLIKMCEQEIEKNGLEEMELSLLEDNLARKKGTQKVEQISKEIRVKEDEMGRRLLPLVGFIGELYKVNILTPKLMVDLINHLLFTHRNRNMEALCNLLEMVGQRLEINLKNIEKNASKNKNIKFIPEEGWMDGVYFKLMDCLNDKGISVEIREKIWELVKVRNSQRKSNGEIVKEMEKRRDNAFEEELSLFLYGKKK